ncbi:MAG: ABC transporter ATP-binding protein [Spirochaetales bacterium]|nr:ABC transporter ATP-binding protein [Spirochaetales bacterium]
MSLRVANLRKEFRPFFSRRPPITAVRKIDFEIEPGKIYALLGPNGAGKSTTIKMIAGLIQPTSGQVYINGRPVSPGHPEHYKNLSAVLEGTRNVYWRLNPIENLHYFANLRGVSSQKIEKRSEELLTLLELDARKKNQSQHLSRGMLQKLALAVALITDPRILLLDEPTLGLDISSARRIREVILHLAHKEGRIILLTTHQMELVESVADHVGIIREGELAIEGSIANLRKIFASFIYRLKIKGRFVMPAAWKKYNAIVKQSNDDFTELELDLGSKDGMFAVLADLQKKGSEIIQLDRNTDDLEEIFLRVLERKPEQANA